MKKRNKSNPATRRARRQEEIEALTLERDAGAGIRGTQRIKSEDVVCDHFASSYAAACRAPERIVGAGAVVLAQAPTICAHAALGLHELDSGAVALVLGNRFRIVRTRCGTVAAYVKTKDLAASRRSAVVVPSAGSAQRV